jgi:thioredoxin reductase (NADPH)
MNTQKLFDVIIIGAGPAGLSAAIYTARDGRSTLLIEKGAIGGQAINTSLVENFPGFEAVSGIDLTQAMYRQAKKYGLDEVYTEVTGIEVKEAIKVVHTTNGNFQSKVVIVAAGLERQKLGVPGEAEFTGRGVSFCATCDGAFFRKRQVVVVGGGDAAITEALELTRFASKVSIIHRRHELRATKVLQDRAFAEPIMEFIWDSAIEEITGDTSVKRIKVRNIKTGHTTYLDVSGVFIAVGFKANAEYLKNAIKLDENGSIVTNDKMETSASGILAAGDIRSGSIRQLVASAGDGAVAAVTARKYLSG